MGVRIRCRIHKKYMEMRVCVTSGVTCKVRYKCGYRNGGLYLYGVGGYKALGKRSKQLKFFLWNPILNDQP